MATVDDVEGFDPSEEMHTCSVKLIELQGDMEEFDQNNKRNEYDRIHSRLIYVQNRLRRIASLSSEQSQTQKLLLQRCWRL